MASILTTKPTAVQVAQLHYFRRVSDADQSKTTGMVVAMRKNVWRAVIEVGFIIFLFYPIS
jgi:hypothetical protein